MITPVADESESPRNLAGASARRRGRMLAGAGNLTCAFPRFPGKLRRAAHPVQAKTSPRPAATLATPPPPEMHRLTSALCCLAALAASSPAATAADAIASHQATLWDKEITLPPNAYRAAKPVELNGDFTVTTRPGTLLEGVSFLTRGGVQHWHLDGTLLRRVRITGKRYASGHGIDSVFEDWEFNKDDNWYSFWWSTRWKFDNCIFTKRFIRGELTTVDYSAHADHCTFYGVKLPGINLKDNPATYLQQSDMAFVKCRFVDCDVPQTFLAATVDCVFEGCRFEPKNKVNWPKETGPIKVAAYYAGTGGEPSSFLNGPLTVQFTPASRGAAYGSTLPHAQSGGRVTLTNLRLNGQFAQLASINRKASEIVDPLAAPPETNAPAPAPTPAPGAAAAPAGGELHGVEEILRGMPPTIEVIAAGEPNSPGIEAANAWLARTWAGRPASMSLTLESTQAIRDEGYAYQANGRAESVLYHGATIPARVVALFRAAAAAPLAGVAPNAGFAVRGTVRKAEFVGRGRALILNLSIGESSVPDKLTAPPPAAEVTPPPGDEEIPDYFGSKSSRAVIKPTPVPKRLP